MEGIFFDGVFLVIVDDFIFLDDGDCEFEVCKVYYIIKCWLLWE